MRKGSCQVCSFWHIFGLSLPLPFTFLLIASPAFPGRRRMLNCRFFYLLPDQKSKVQKTKDPYSRSEIDIYMQPFTTLT